jgi:hypothetical protein
MAWLITGALGVILYHLNAMEEPYDKEYPKVPGFLTNFGPRNIARTAALGTHCRPS